MDLKPIFHTPVMHFDDINGRPLVGGRLYSYKAGTNTSVNLYRDPQGTLRHENPIRLNMRGECVAYGKENLLYKLVLKDRFGATIWEVDNVSASGGGSGGGGGGGGSGMSPSILVARSSTYITGDDDAVSQNFTFTEVNKIGDDVYVDDGKVKCKEGTYKVSITIDIAVNPTNPKRPWTEQVTCNYYNSGYATYLIDRTIDEPHSANTGTIEFIAVVSFDDTELPVSLVGLGTGCYASVVQYGISKIAEDE